MATMPIKPASNYQFSELAYHSTESATSSDVSSGVGSCRAGTALPDVNGKAGNAAQKLPKSKLFKGVAMCPPINGKITSPSLIHQKNR